MRVDIMTAPKAAARWWRRILEGNTRWDNGDAKCNAVATICGAGKLKYTKEEYDAFETKLQQIIEDALGTPYFSGDLSVDYHPGRMLVEAATDTLPKSALESDLLVWPCKTSLWIERWNDPNKYWYVQAAYGYRAPIRRIFGTRYGVVECRVKADDNLWEQSKAVVDFQSDMHRSDCSYICDVLFRFAYWTYNTESGYGDRTTRDDAENNAIAVCKRWLRDNIPNWDVSNCPMVEYDWDKVGQDAICLD